jgi:hypothetical protein
VEAYSFEILVVVEVPDNSTPALKNQWLGTLALRDVFGRELQGIEAVKPLCLSFRCFLATRGPVRQRLQVKVAQELVTGESGQQRRR